MKQPGNPIEGKTSRIFWAADDHAGGGGSGDAAAAQKAELLQKYGPQLGTLYEAMRMDAQMVPVLGEYRKVLTGEGGGQEDLDKHWRTVEEYLKKAPGFQNLQEAEPVLREFVEGKLREQTVDKRMEPWAEKQFEALMERTIDELLDMEDEAVRNGWGPKLDEILRRVRAKRAGTKAEGGSV